MTEKNDVIARDDLSPEADPSSRPNSIDDQFKKKNVQKMVVDKLGLHCVVISDHELYYMNWSDTRVHKMSAITDESTDRPQ